ncbi:hypothetical protein [Lysinibacillus xylanilyticus]|uniref:hypothetical protein n=1 Tax=Lysinibacillus xylanilyticus TaxID=582475 RepID=UPI0036D93B4D
MHYSEGMGIEVPVWVIQSASGKRTLNRKTNKMQREVTKDCVFNDPKEANDKLKMMDYGYVVTTKRHYLDSGNDRIW